jgi:hypothetical protein
MANPDAHRALNVGLCASCRFSRVVENKRGSRFYLCLLSETDTRFRKYPALPVTACSGYSFCEQATETQRRPATSND